MLIERNNGTVTNIKNGLGVPVPSKAGYKFKRLRRSEFERRDKRRDDGRRLSHRTH